MAKLAVAATPRPTALFAANNFIAIGVLHALDEMELRVPEDVAVVGFDDLPPAMVTFPFLTVAAQPAYEMGQRRSPCCSIACPAAAAPASRARRSSFRTQLIVRRSSGGPAGRPGTLDLSTKGEAAMTIEVQEHGARHGRRAGTSPGTT